MKNNLFLTLFLFFNAVGFVSSAQIISTIAGIGVSACSGDGGPATNAALGNTRGVAVDSAGNVYFQDYWYHRVRKISTTGIISTVAGTGVAGYSGDGGPATNATINGCNDVIVDSLGNIYIAEIQNACVRKITTSGIITTIAGNGTSVYSGDGVPATATGLTAAAGLTMDRSGNLYIVEAFGNVVRKVNAAGIITTIAGNGTTGFSGDGGPATAARLWHPQSVAVDRAGNVFIADNANRRIRKIDLSGIITTYAGDGIAGDSGDGGLAAGARFTSPNAVSIDQFDNLYVCDGSSGRIRKISPDGIIVTVAGIGTNGYSGDGGPATNAQITPFDMVTDQHGNLFIADLDNMRVRKITCTAPLMSTITGISGMCAGNIATLTTTTSGGVWSSLNALVCSVSGSGAVTAISEGAAIISYSISNSCFTTTDTMMFHTMSAPDTGIIMGSTYVCQAGMTTLSASATGGTWSCGATTVSVSSTGTVTGISLGTAIITYSISNTCGTSTDTMMVAILALPDAGTITGTPEVCAGGITTLTNTITGGEWISSTGDADVTDGVVTGINTGTVTIFYSVTNMCGNANDTMMVTILPVPLAGPIAGGTPVCTGETITLTNSSGGGTWSSSATATATIDAGGIVSGISAGSTTISYILSNSCGADTATATIMVNTIPEAGTLSGLPEVCPGNTITLTPSVAGGTWISGNSALATISGGTVSGVAAGSVTMYYIVSNSCGADTASMNITILPISDCPTNVGIPQQQSSITLYPNPNNGTFTISGNWLGANGSVSVEIVNMLGQVIYNEPVTATNGNIHALLQPNNLAAGNYMVRLKGTPGVTTLRFTVSD